jgi:hypothetical protein
MLTWSMVRGLEVDGSLLGGGAGSAGGQQGEALDQLPPAQRAFLEPGHEIGNDRFHDLPLEGWMLRRKCSKRSPD